MRHRPSHQVHSPRLIVYPNSTTLALLRSCLPQTITWHTHTLEQTHIRQQCMITAHLSPGAATGSSRILPRACVYHSSPETQQVTNGIHAPSTTAHTPNPLYSR